MRQCYDDPEEAGALGAIGQAEAKEKLSLKAAGERMAEQLAKVPAFAQSIPDRQAISARAQR
jgi:hypothetical protein